MDNTPTGQQVTTLPLHECPDLMVDIETTGVDSHRNAILQIAAVPFCFERRLKGDVHFNYALRMPNTRLWDDETRKWWMGSKAKQEVFMNITRYQQPVVDVLKIFSEFARNMKGASEGDVRFWSNHPFDWDFIQSYYNDFMEGFIPFKYRWYRDLESVIMGLSYPNIDNKHKIKKDNSRAHDAIYDVHFQIDWLFNAVEQTRPLQVADNVQVQVG